MAVGVESTTNDSRPLATFPWVAFCNDPKLTLEQSAAFQNVAFSSHQEKENNIAVFKGFNKWFPFYISPAYHKMSVKDFVTERPHGKYWADAINFLISTKGSNSFAWKIFQEHLECGNKCPNSSNFPCPDMEVPESVMANYYKEGPPAQCQWAEDFLLNPWIIIQIQYQPALFHQWLVAYSAEVSKIWMEMSELYYLPYDDQFKQDVNDLKKLLEKASEFTVLGFRFLQSCVDSTRRQEKFEFPELNVALHILDVHFKHDLVKVIRSYKKCIWANSEVPQRKERASHYCWNELKNIYNVSFWRNAAPNRKIFYDSENTWVQNEEEETEENGTIEDLLASLQACCSSQLDTDDELKKLLKSDKTFKRALMDLRKNQNIAALLRIRKEERGIIGIMMSISVYERIIIAANRAKRRYCEVTGIHPRKLLKFSYDDLPDEDIAKKFIQKNLLKCNNDKFCFDKYIKEIETTFEERFGRQPNYAEPDLEEKPDVIASKFEENIVSLVIERVKYHHTVTLKEDSNIVNYIDPGMNDWQFPQLILPCFVATILEAFSSKDKPANNAKQQWLTAIVDKLISEYKKMSFETSLEDYEDKIEATYILKKFSSPIFLRATFRSTILYFSHLLLGEDALDYMRINQLLDILTANRPPNHKIFQQNCTFNTLTYKFLDTLQNALLSKSVPFAFNKNAASSFYAELLDLLAVILHVGFYPDFKLDINSKAVAWDLLLSIVQFCLDQKASKDDLKSTRRLKKILKIDEKSFFDKAKEEVEKLTFEQMLSLIIYLTLKLVPSKNFSSLKRKEKSPSPIGGYLQKYVAHGNSRPFISSLNFVFEEKIRTNIKDVQGTAPVLYYVAMNDLYKDSNGLRKKFTSRIDSQIFPIKHCRYCGKVDAILDRMCDLCASPDNPLQDVLIFCSDECKEKALKEFHKQEHDSRKNNM